MLSIRMAREVLDKEETIKLLTCTLIFVPSTDRIIEKDHKVDVVRKPTDSKDYEDDNKHLGHLPHLLLGSPVIVLVAGDRGLPLEPPEHSAEVSVGDGEPEQRQDISHQEEHHLVHMVHEGGVGRTIWPYKETGGGSVLATLNITMVRLGGGEEDGGAGNDRADCPDTSHGQTKSHGTDLTSRAGYRKVSNQRKLRLS